MNPNVLNVSSKFLPPSTDEIPEALKLLDRWVCWRAEVLKVAPNGKPNKVPYDAKCLYSHASSTNETTWASFAQAETAFHERLGEVDEYTGIGFVLNNDGLVGVDIDDCITNGVINAAALDLIDSIGAQYCEISPSGKGLRAFGYADPLDRGRKGLLNGVAVELYTTGRYLTITGRSVKKGPLVQLKGFKKTAEQISSHKIKVDAETGEIVVFNADERHAELVRRILTGDVYHDSLRDLAASLVATGMYEGAVVNHLRGLMDAASADKDNRWDARRRQIPELVSSAVVKFSDFKEAANDPNFKLLTSADLAQFPPLSWMVKGVLPATGLAAIFGPSGSGKSFLALDLFASVASGLDWYGHRVTKTPVIYVCLEGESGMRGRVDAWEKHHGRKLPNEMRMVLQPFKINSPEDVNNLAKAILDLKQTGCAVILDTLNRSAPNADENSSKDVGLILEGAKRLQILLGGLVVLVHHTGKDVSRGMRGHSSIFAALDASIEVTRNGNHRTWGLAKSKDGLDGGSHAFKLEIVELQIDDDGDQVTSCVAVPNGDVGQGYQAALKPKLQQAMQSLYQACIGHGHEDGVNLTVALEAWRHSFYQSSTSDGLDAKRSAFTRARKELVELGAISVNDDFYSVPLDDPGLQRFKDQHPFKPDDEATA